MGTAIPETLHAKLKATAAKERRSVAAFLLLLIERRFSRSTRKAAA